MMLAQMRLTRSNSAWLHLSAKYLTAFEPSFWQEIMTEKDNDIDDPDVGIELDKIKVPKTDSAPSSQEPGTSKAPISEKPGKTEPEAESEIVLPKKIRLKVIMAVAAIVLAAALFFLWNQKIIKLPFLARKGKDSAKASPAYHTIAPIITNLGEKRHIQISLMIENNPELTQQISAVDPIIRDDILMLLTSAEVKRMIKESDLEKLKSYIETKIKNLLKSNYNDKIILKELKVY